MSFRHFTPSGQVNPENRSDADRIEKLTFEHGAFVKRPKAIPEPSRFRSIMPVPQDTYSSGNIVGFMQPWLRVIPNRALSVFSAPFKQVQSCAGPGKGRRVAGLCAICEPSLVPEHHQGPESALDRQVTVLQTRPRLKMSLQCPRRQDLGGFA